MTVIRRGERRTAAEIDAEATVAAGMLTITGHTEWVGVEAGCSRPSSADRRASIGRSSPLQNRPAASDVDAVTVEPPSADA
jgi:hypothetical protein